MAICNSCRVPFLAPRFSRPNPNSVAEWLTKTGDYASLRLLFARYEGDYHRILSSVVRARELLRFADNASGPSRGKKSLSTVIRENESRLS